MTERQAKEVDSEIVAISEVYAALKDLEADAQARVLKYVAEKLKIGFIPELNPEPAARASENTFDTKVNEAVAVGKEEPDQDLGGISSVAQRWMLRNGLNVKQLSSLFSLGGDDIDLVANTVPGTDKKKRMRSVCLLKGVAAYLATGAARFTHQQVKETCLHYDAYDAPNFSKYLKSLSSEMSGDKSTGYSLTPRGLTNATEMIKSIFNQPKE